LPFNFTEPAILDPLSPQGFYFLCAVSDRKIFDPVVGNTASPDSLCAYSLLHYKLTAVYPYREIGAPGIAPMMVLSAKPDRLLRIDMGFDEAYQLS
jgi:hypothetical protein